MTKVAFQKSRAKTGFRKSRAQNKGARGAEALAAAFQKSRTKTGFRKSRAQSSQENNILINKGTLQLLEKTAPKEALDGINDPNGIYNNPFTNEPYKNLYANEIRDIKGEKLPCTYANFAKIWTDLLVYKNKDELIEKITHNQIILAKAGTGVGKTVLIPRIALHTLNYKEKVICTVPKRLLARKNATFISECMDVKLGEQVGYYYQGDNETNKNGVQTKLIFTTTGSIISRITGNDPMLADYKCIIVDEAHERSVDTDQLLLLLKNLCKIRKDLKVIIMSATINLEIFRNYFPKSIFKFGEVDVGSETMHEVKQIFMERPTDWKKTASDITIKLLKKTNIGDIMIFVKSAGDANIIIGGIEKGMIDFRNDFIKNRQLSQNRKLTKRKSGSGSGSGSGSMSRTKTQKSRKSFMKTNKEIEAESYVINPFCVKLEGSSPKKESDLATSKTSYKKEKNDKGYPYTRKVVVSTNVAESSLTVDGIIYIIDSGYEYEELYEPNSRANGLIENNIAQSAVLQRKGRAGRIEPGVCIHLYSKRDFEGFQKYPTPSIEKSDITGNILDIMRMKDSDTVKKMRSLLDQFISPPHEKFIINSLKTLEALGAITSLDSNGVITPMGQAITKFRAISPCFARSIIASHFYGVSRSVCDIIALCHSANGRIGNFFIKYYPDKKKGADWNKKEYNRHINIMKSFKHPYGDYMSMLKAYKMYLKFIGSKNEDEKDEKDGKDGKDGVNDANDNNQTSAENIIEENIQEDDVKMKPSVKKWCKDNFINPRKLATVKQTSMQLYRTLQEIMKPYQYERPKGMQKLSMKEIAEINEKISIMEINSVLDEIEPGMVKTNDVDMQQIDKDMQSGGFVRRIAKEEEMEKLEKNVKRFDKEDDNIMMALAIGNFVNIAAIANGTRNMYKSCFAIDKKMCRIDMDSFIKDNPKIVLFEEIFMSSLESRMLKLNMVNMLPNNVWERIKNEYGKYIKFCV